MTLEEIKQDCDRAQQDEGLDFTELSLETLIEWVRLNPNQDADLPFDVVTLCTRLEEWWLEQKESTEENT